MRCTGVLLVTFVAAAAIRLAAFDPLLDPRSLADAIQLGQSSVEDMRSRFNAPYRITVGDAPVDDVEIVTPFRRVVLDAESHARAGDHMYGQRVALEMLGDDPSRIDVVVELTFHPQNNFVGVPEFSVTLQTPAGDLIQPRTTSKMSRFTPRVARSSLTYPYTTGSSAPNGSQPLLGGVIIATFDAKALNPRGSYVVMVVGAVGEPVKAPVDFGKLR